MKIANADKLIHHFEHTVMVKTFTVPEIVTIINTFTLDLPEGDKLVFHTDEDGTQLVTNLSEQDRLEEILNGTGLWARHDEWRNKEYIGGFYHIGCLAVDGIYIKWPSRYCPNCGKKMDMNTPKEAEP